METEIVTSLGRVASEAEEPILSDSDQYDLGLIYLYEISGN